MSGWFSGVIVALLAGVLVLQLVVLRRLSREEGHPWVCAWIWFYEAKSSFKGECGRSWPPVGRNRPGAHWI